MLRWERQSQLMRENTSKKAEHPAPMLYPPEPRIHARPYKATFKTTLGFEDLPVAPVHYWEHETIYNNSANVA